LSSFRGTELKAGSRQQAQVRPHPAATGTAALARSGTIVAFGVGLAAALQAGFHLAVARIVGPADYSLLAAMFTLVLIATPAALALQAAVAGEVAWRVDREGEAAAGLVLRDTVSALVRRVTALFVLFIPFGVLAAVLVDVRHPLPVIATLMTIAGLLMFSLALGGLQGVGRLGRVSAAQCWFASLKLCAGVGLALLGFAAGGVMLGVAAATWTAALISAVSLRRIWQLGGALRSRPRRILRGFAGGPALVLTLFAALSSMGVLVARLSFTQHMAGGYAAISFGSYALLVIVLTVTTVLFPRAATLRDADSERLHLLNGLAAVAILGAIGTVVLFAFPETIVRIAFGAKYVFAAPWLGPLGIAMTLFALGNVYIYHFLSLGRSQGTLLLAGLFVAQVALFAFFHSTPDDLIGVLIASAALLLVGSELLERSLRRHGLLIREVREQELFVPLQAIEPIRDLADSDEEVTIVIPAYDEASRIGPTLHGTAACMEDFGCPYEILVVDDGSRDATRAVSEQVASELDGVRVIGYKRNAGKGHAIVEGARAARGGLVLFLDADLEVHPRQLQVLYEAMQEANADVGIGSKVHSDSQVDYPGKRQVMSWGYYAIVRLCFGLPVRDTQTGLKLFRKEVLDGVVPRMLVKRFAFDLEALVIAHRLGFRVVEAPVVVTRERDLPKIGWTDALHTAWDTAAVWYRAYLRRYYDEVKEPRSPSVASPDRSKRD
jgi:O-antigen/teichoic acid export membrane protein